MGKQLEGARLDILGFSFDLWKAATIVLLGVFLVLLWVAGAWIVDRLGKREATERASNRTVGSRWHILVQLFGNWRLALLGITGIVLSLASGWTTWDGMRNFTGEPILALMITFGIQGVMLICAWLIGETFARSATGGETAETAGETAWQVTKTATQLLIAALIVFGAIMIASSFVKSDVPGQLAGTLSYNGMWLVGGVGAALALAFLLVTFSRAEIIGPYARGTRVILANLHLWVMFLACMGASVFFSFDSLFSSIFPQSERVRAAELRAQNQVAGIVADIGTTIATKRLAESDRLFETEGWKAYDENLTKLARASLGAEQEIEAYFVRQMEDRRRGIAQQQERIASAQGGQAGLQTRKVTLTEEMSRLKAERPALAAELAEKKTELDNRAKAIDAKRVEAMAEDKGVEGTGKVGKGPVYRQRMDEMGKMQDYYKIQEDRVRDAQKRVTAIDTRIAQLDRELAGVDGEIAKLKGEAATAEQRIKVAEESKAGEEGPKVDPARVRAAFERARAEFRQEPTVERLAQVQQMCGQLYGAMAATPATKERVRGIDCDPKQASEAAGHVFALNAGIVAFSQNCMGGDKLAQHKSADALFEFSRKCLADSGLPSKETDELRGKINFIELSRDDKAHRFVVTWNAFLDGNRLAYLALSLAVAIDGLIFMSGLFGANAVASPLSGTPEARRRSVTDLESVIDSTLRPHKLDTAELAINLMEPVRLPRFPGYTVSVDLNPVVGELGERQRFAVRKVLTAGAGLGLVAHVPRYPGLYLIRRELHEYLLKVAEHEHKRGREADHVFVMPRLDPARSVAGRFLMEEEVHRNRIGMAEGVRRKISERYGLDQFDTSPPMAPPAYHPAGGYMTGGEHVVGVNPADGARAIPQQPSPQQISYRQQRPARARPTSKQEPAAPALQGGAGSMPMVGTDLVVAAQRVASKTSKKGNRYSVSNEIADLELPDGPVDAAAVPSVGEPSAMSAAQQAAASKAALYDEASERFLEALGLNAEEYESFAEPAVWAKANDAGLALDELSRDESPFAATLARGIDQAEQARRRALKDALAGIIRQGDVDEQSARELHELADDFGRLVLVSLLMGEHGYAAILRQIKLEIEQPAGTGSLSPAEQRFLKALSKHEREISRSARTSPIDWQQVQVSINKFRNEVAEAGAIAGAPEAADLASRAAAGSA
jgi:hypothetical protein